MKEIHFYKDCTGELFHFFLQEGNNYYITHDETIKAIEENESIINTTAISSLCFSDLIDKGYTIVLHENGKYGIVYPGRTCLTNKEIRKEHNIQKLWIGGAFNAYFYKREKINDLIGYSNYE